MATNFHAKILRRKTTPEEYRVYRAGLEWDLADPIVIEKREDIKSAKRWRDLMEPFHHQVTNLITFCRRLPVTLLADDVGLGKTISAGLIVSELIARARVSKILVVCPKLLGPQWKEELNTKFDLAAEIAIGRDLVKADPEDIGAIITTYASARLHLDSIPNDRFQMLILDEAHKLRNLYGVENPPQVAKKFRNALENRRFRYVLMLTATPIHNRLWDLYSMIDLLTVARGHQNPFGNEGLFARKFIADNREQARHLKPEARDEFRSIVYGYMSRVRRGDAKLYFPEREVQMHRVEPSVAELELIRVIAKPIQKLNRLAQISILQALASSPDALMSQLNNMARNGTVPAELAFVVRQIVGGMPVSAKLVGLGALIERLKKESPHEWRLVIFTTRLETQTTIQAFLENYDLKVGIINGSSGQRNQETIARFRKDPPDCHVIVSTEAGSEGVNLQVANVLVNYDLPWNPMIVEQRIGRIQRLASRHAKVAIFNIMLRGTFEEYIVGRLMEKLQMASHAIGDIEALLEASGVDEDDEQGATSFEERIRQLVIASLAGKDVDLETRQAVASIEDAKAELEREKTSIDEMLGASGGKEYVGPRAPKLPDVVRTMNPREFTLLALKTLGVHISAQSLSGFVAEENGGRELCHFEGDTPSDARSTLYAPGSSAFLRLINRIVATGVHDVRDLDDDLIKVSEQLARQWVNAFSGVLTHTEISDVRRHFAGNALVRVRATVAHDSYERLVNISCSSDGSGASPGRSGLGPLPRTIDDPRALGISVEYLVDTAQLDEGISEFSRFYRERRELEVQAAGTDDRKRKKLEDEFTPRVEVGLVGLEGELHRDLTLNAKYKLDGEYEYASTLAVRPHDSEIVTSPKLARCAKTGRVVPWTCLKECQISGATVLEHLLARSEKSKRTALPEFTVVCALSGKRVLNDEVEQSAITGRSIERSLLRTSAISGKRAEPEYFGQCEFTKDEVLLTEISTSDISGKKHRQDQRRRSVVSGKAGHKEEFIVCHQTGHSLTLAEAERCEVTGHYVQPGILEQCAVTRKKVLPTELERCELTNKRVLRSELEQCQVTGKRVLRSELEQCAVSGKRVLPTELEVCAVTGKRVLPSELERCAVTGKRAVRGLFVSSSVSGLRLLEDAAIRSATGKFCTPTEARPCAWSGRQCHPDDLRVCELTGLSVRFQFAGSVKNGTRLQPLVELLDGVRRNTDGAELWGDLASKVAVVLGKGRCQVEAAVLSPDAQQLAVCVEVRTLLGFRVHYVGGVYSIGERSFVGRIAQGQRRPDGWAKAQT